MNLIKTGLVCLCTILTLTSLGQAEKRKLAIQRTTANITIDGELKESVWATAPVADKFIELRPVPFRPENPSNYSQVYFLYDNEGVYVGGYLHENNKDSIASELIGRDGFGNNDFIGVIFDTYVDKLNGFEYFVTPLGEQMDAKQSPSNGEDFSWNAVWKSASKIQSDGWSFEMFIPYSAIRFGNKKVQDWGLNIVRRRQKSGQQMFWQAIDPNVNGFLTQEGFLTGLQDMKPPMRLQFSPYFSTYYTNDGTAPAGTDKSKVTFNGGMDVKYGINQAFTLDMTLIPDFGQVQTDNEVLNLSPFDVRFNENRAFFTEGTELFNKGNLFYSRRIGLEPVYSRLNYPGANDSLIDNPSQAKVINATKISGRTQKGLGIGILNAITQKQYAEFQNTITGKINRTENMPLTNYNVFVLDQTLKHNSSISLINTNVWRSGDAYDANVTSALFDFNNKKNVYNIGGNISFSNIMQGKGKTVTGYAHSIYMGKTSGRLNFNIWQDLYNDKYDKSDMGYFTNNNTMDQGFWLGYNWLKPKKWYNQMRINFNGWYGRLVSPIDPLRRSKMMYQNFGGNINGSAQTKKLRWFGFSMNVNADYNDFYEPRKYGRVFHNRGSYGLNVWYESNSAKKYSWTGNFFAGTGGVFKRVSYELGLTGKARFSSKFSVDFSTYITDAKNQPGWAFNSGDTVIFSRRSVATTENVLNVKYNFTNRMGLNLRVRHYWSKVDPKQFYELDMNGGLIAPTRPSPITENVNQNFNFIGADMIYNWQFAQGSFLSVAWKDIGRSFNREFEKSYMKNLSRVINEDQYNSVSVKVIYFIDYLTARNKLKRKK